MSNRKPNTMIRFLTQLTIFVCGIMLLVGAHSIVYADEGDTVPKDVALVEQDTGPGDTGPSVSLTAVSDSEICSDGKSNSLDIYVNADNNKESEAPVSTAEGSEEEVSVSDGGNHSDKASVSTVAGSEGQVSVLDTEKTTQNVIDKAAPDKDSADIAAADADDAKADAGVADADDIKADAGDTGADTDDTKADADDTKADAGDTGADADDTKADADDAKADAGVVAADPDDTDTDKENPETDADNADADDDSIEVVVSDTATEINVNTDKNVVIDIEKEGEKIVLSISADKKKTVYANSEAVTKVTITSEKDVSLGENAKKGLLGKDFNIINMPLASVSMRATNVLLISDENAPLTWFLKNLDIKAIPADKWSPTLVVQKEDYKAELVNQIINASGDVSIISCNKKDPSKDEDALEEILDITIGDGDHISEIAKQVIKDIKQDPAKLKEIFGEMTNDTSLLVIVKTQDTAVSLTNTKITANNIDVTSYNRNTAFVNGLFGGITVAVINTDSKVLVQDSVLTAHADHVNITAKSLVNSKGDVMFNKIPFSLALQIILGDTKVDIIGSQITSKGDINILVDRCATVKGSAAGDDKRNFKQSGVFIAIGTVSGEYAVTIKDSAAHISSLDAARNVSVRTEHFEEVTIEAVAQKTHFDSLAGGYYTNDIDVSVQKITDCLELVMGEYVYSKVFSVLDQKVYEPILKNVIAPIGDKIGDALGSMVDANSTILVDDFVGQYSDSTHGAVRVKLKNEAMAQALTIPSQTMITLSQEGEGGHDYSYTFDSDKKEALIENILPGTYKVSIKLPQNYKQLYTKNIEVKAGQILSLRIFPSEVDYNKNQFAGTLGVDVVLVDAKVTIDSKGEIKAGKDVLVRADSITRVNNTADASAIDTIFTKIPTDATIVAAVVTPNTEQSVAGTFYLSDEAETMYNTGITTADEYKRVVIFDHMKAVDGKIPYKTLDVGNYHLYFTVPDNYDIVDTATYTPAEKKPAFISDEDWNKPGVKWYLANVKLDYADRPYTDLDGKPHYDILGNPFLEHYIKGITAFPKVKLKGSNQGDIPADTRVIGVAIGLSYVKQNTAVKIDSVSITAQSITAEALNNQYKGTFKPTGLIKKNEKGEQVKDKDGKYVYVDTLSSKSDLTTKAGFSTGRTGVAGSIAVNIANSNVSADINSGKLFFTKNGALAINAHGGLFGNTSASGTGRKRDNAANAVGAGLAFSVFNEDVNAILGEQASIERYVRDQNLGIDSIIITAVNDGCQIAGAVSGGIGTDVVAPGLLVNVTVSETNARMKGSEINPVIYMTGRGDVVVSALSNQQQSSNVTSSAAGHDLAVGVSVAVGVSSYKQNALIEREIQDANDVIVTAESRVPITGSAIAGTSGAAPKVSNEKGKISGDPAPSPDEIAEAALKAACEALAEEDEEKAQEIPQEVPQRAESSEGSVDVGASTVFVIYKNRNTAKITAKVTCQNDLSVTAKHLVTMTAKADSSAVISKTGVGVAVSIAHSDIENTAVMGADVTAGSIRVQAVNPVATVKDKDGKTKEEAVPNSVNVSTAAGVGASDVGVAGTLSLNIYKEKYRAEMGNAELKKVGASSCLIAEPHQKLTVYSGAASNEDTAGSDSAAKPSGYGAGVGMTFAYIDADAIVRDGSVISAKGSFTVHSETYNSMDVHAYAGDDPYTEVPVKEKVQLIFQDTDGKRLAGVKAGNGIVTSSISDVAGIMNFDYVEDGFYEIRVYEVPDGYQLPTSAFTFTVTPDGYKKTVTLLKNDQISKPKYKAVDAAVAINLLSSHVNATIGNGCSVVTDGDLSVLAVANTDTWAYTRGKASAEKTAAGMSAAANIAHEEINALQYGNVTVGGNFKVDALSHSSDQATAYATASGLVLERLAEQYGIEITDLMQKSKFTKWITTSLPAYAPTTNITRRFDILIKPILQDSGLFIGEGYSVATKVLYYGNVGISNIKAAIKYLSSESGSAEDSEDAAKKGEEGKVEVEESPDGISVAAAAGLNITKHNAKSLSGGTVKMTNGGNVAVTAEGQNNYKAIGSGEAVANQSAIAVGVAFVINNNEVSAKVLKSVADQNNKAGTVDVKASALQNLSDGYNDDVTVQAIAGSAKGQKSSGIGAAGAFAVFFNNMTTEAQLADSVKIYAKGKVSVDATEKSKLSARAWGATLAAPLFDKEGGVIGGKDVLPVPEDKSSGVGASFAVIHANNKTIVTIGNYVTVEADEFEALALKERVSKSDYRYDGLDINGQFIIPIVPNLILPVNTTGWGGREAKPDSALPVTFEELLEEGISLVNILASRNYYVEAVGGAVSHDSKLSAAGSFSYVFMHDVADVIIGDHFTLVTAKDASIKAGSDVNFALIGGSLAYGGKTGAGAAVTAVINKEEVKSLIGSYFTFTGADLTVDARAKADVLEVLVAAAASYPRTKADTGIISTSTAVDGVINIYVGDTDVKAFVGPRAILTAGKMIVHAENICAETGVTGGAALGAGRGLGTSVNVVSLNSKAIAEICEGLTVVKSAGVDVTAYQKNSLLNIVANGAMPLSADSKNLVAVNPAVYVDKTVTKALLGTAAEGEKNVIQVGSEIHSTGKVNVAAEDHTEIINVNGAVGVSTGATAVGGAATVQVLIKDVKAIIADGTAAHNVKIYADGGVRVHAAASENLKSFVIGLGGGKDSSASGSINIVVVSNNIEAAIGDYAQIDKKLAGANVLVHAGDDIYALSGTGAITVSSANSAYGLSNVDIILDGTTLARTGKHVLLNADSITVDAVNKLELISISVSGAVADRSTLEGSVVTTVLNQTTKAVVGENTTIDALGDMKVTSTADMKIIDAAGTLGLSTAVRGASVDTVVIGGKNLAIIGKGTVIRHVRDLTVQADTKENLKNVTVGVAGSAGDRLSAEGSIVTVVKKMLTAAVIGNLDEAKMTADAAGVDINSDGNVIVAVFDNGEMISIAGNLGLAVGSSEIAAGVITVSDIGSHIAEIGDNATIDANAKTPAHDFPNGDVTVETIVPTASNTSLNYRKARRNYNKLNGIMVGAFANNTYSLTAVSASVTSGTGDAAPAVSTLVQEGKTYARVGTKAQLNTRNRERRSAACSVTVASSSDTEESVAAGSAPLLGKGGISAAAATEKNSEEVIAELGKDSVVEAEKDIRVNALHKAEYYVNGVGVSVSGKLGLGASLSILLSQETVKAVTDGKLTAKTGDIEILAVSDNFAELTAITIQGGATGADGAAFAIVDFGGKTQAILGAGHDVTAEKDIHIDAYSKEKVVSVIAGGAGSGTESFNGSASGISIHVTTEAGITDNMGDQTAEITADGNLIIRAMDETDLVTAIGGVSGSGTIAAGIAVDVMVYRSTVTAKIGNKNVVTAAAISLLAKADRTVNAHSVMLTGAGTSNVQGSIVVLSIGSNVRNENAEDIDGNKKLSANIAAEMKRRTDHAISMNPGFAVQNVRNNKYVAAVNETLKQVQKENSELGVILFTERKDVKNSTSAYIGDGGTTTSTKGDIRVEAVDRLTLYTTAGAAGGSAGVSVGVSAVVAVLKNMADASIGGIVKSEGDIIVQANNIFEAKELAAVGGGGSTSVAVNGTVEVVVIETAARAVINANAEAKAEGNVVVYADSDAMARIINGNAGGSGFAAVGAAINVVVVKGETTAEILAKSVTAHAGTKDVQFINGNITGKADGDAFKKALDVEHSGTVMDQADQQKLNAVSTQAEKEAQAGVLVGAHSRDTFYNWVAAAGGAGTAAVMGSVNVVVFERTTKSSIENSDVKAMEYQGDVVVSAVGHSAMQDIVGSITGSGVAGVGIANDTLKYDNTVVAEIVRSDVTADGNIVISAKQDQKLLAIAVGAGGGMIAVNDSNAVVVETQKTKALVDNCDLEAEGSIRILADSYQDATIVAGSANGGLGSVGIGVVVVSDQNETIADVSGKSVLVAKGKTESDGETGFIMHADADTDMNVISFGASGGIVGAAPATTVFTDKSTVKASTAADTKVNKVSQKQIDAAADVIFIAKSDKEIKAGAGSVAGGAAAVSVAVIVYDAENTVTACAGGSIYAGNRLIVQAFENDRVEMYAVGAGGGIVSSSNSGSSFNFTSHVTAAAEGDLDVNSFKVNADTRQSVDAYALVASGGMAAIEAAVNVVKFNSTTKSYVNSNKTSFAKDSEITASSREVIGAKAEIAAVSGLHAIASVLVADIRVTTQAYTTDKTKIAGVDDGSLTIRAKDDAEIFFDVASVGASAIGNGNAAVAVINFENTVSALVGKNNTITVKSFDLIAEAKRELNGNTIAGGAAGYGALSGAVIVINIGDVLKSGKKSDALKGIDTLAINNSDKAVKNPYFTNKGQNGADIRDLANDATAKISFSIAEMFTKKDPSHATSSIVGEESVITISGKSRMEVKDETILNVLSGSGAGAIGGSVGASVLETSIKGDVLAIIHGSIVKNSNEKHPAADLSVTASQKLNTVNHKVFQGSAGLIGSLGASVAEMDVFENIKAELASDGKLVSLGTVEFIALQDMTTEQNVTSADFGLIGTAGKSTSGLRQLSEVMSLVAGENSEENINVYAYSSIDDYIHVLAAGGGVALGVNSAELNVEEKSMITAQVAGKTTVAGNVGIVAQKLLSIDAECEGVEVAIGISTGASKTTIEVQPYVYAKTDAVIRAEGAVNVLALYNKNRDGSEYRGHKDEYNEHKGNIYSNASACGGAVVSDITGIETKIRHADTAAENVCAIVNGTISSGDLFVKTDSYCEIQATNKTYAFGGILSRGKINIDVTDKLTSTVHINGRIDAKKDVNLDAGQSSRHNAYVKGLGGGIFVAGDKLVLTLISDTRNGVYVNADITAGENLYIHSDKRNNSKEQIDGYSVSGIIAIGDSELKTTLNAVNEILVDWGNKLTAGKLLSVKADTNIERNSRAYASTITGVDANSDAKNDTDSKIETRIVANGTSLYAGDGLEVVAASHEKPTGHAKEYLAGFLCFGNAKLVENITDDVYVSLEWADVEVQKGKINLIAQSVVENTDFDIDGGNGACGSNIKEQADVTIYQNALIFLQNAAIINNYTDDININTIIGSGIKVTGEGDYKDFVSVAKTHAISTVTVDSRILLNNITINSRGNVNITADYSKLQNGVKYKVKSNSGIGADEELIVRIIENAMFTIEGYGNFICAGNLNITAGHEARVDEVKTHAEGEIDNSAAFGSITVTAGNDTHIESHVHINHADQETVLKGQDITLAAYLPGREHYYNRVAKTSGKPGVKEHRHEEGSYTEKTCQELNVKAYTGDFVDVTIEFDKNGASLSKDVNYDLHEDTNTLELHLIEPKTPGKLTLIAEGGSITGKVDLPEKNAVEEMTVINHSPYDLVLDIIDWGYDKMSDDLKKKRISVQAADTHNLSVSSGRELVTAGPSLSVISDNGGNVVFAGELLLPKGKLDVEFIGESGDLLLGENKDRRIKGELAVHAFSVKNAKNVGTPEKPVYVLSLQYKDGDAYVEPTVHVDALEDVFLSTSYVRYFEVSSKHEIDELIDNNRTITASDYIEPISAGGDVVLNILPTYLLFADSSTEYETPFVANPYQTKGEKAEDGRDYTFNAPLKDGMYGFTTEREKYVFTSTSVTNMADLYLEMTGSVYRFGYDESMDRYPDYQKSENKEFIHAGKNAVVNGFLNAGKVLTGNIKAEHGEATYKVIRVWDGNSGENFIGSITGEKGVTVITDNSDIIIGYLESSENIDIHTGGNLSAISLTAPSIYINVKGDVNNPWGNHHNEFGQFVANIIKIIAGGSVGSVTNCIESMPYDGENDSLKVLEIYAGKEVFWHSQISDYGRIVIEVPGKVQIQEVFSDGSVLYQTVSGDNPEPGPTPDPDPEPILQPEPENGNLHTSPATGDSSDLLFWFVLFLGAALVMLTGYKKYRKLR